MNNKSKKKLLIVLVLLYVISPVDFLTGPVDDLFIMILGMIMNGKLKA